MKMVKKKVTLQDIADQVGVSRVTVFRALNNREGMSEEVRCKIQKAAKEMGYSFNYVASSLKRKTIKLDVLMFSDEGDGRYYIKYVWDGYRKARDEITDFNVEIEEHSLKNVEEFKKRLYSYLTGDGTIPDGIMISTVYDQEIEKLLCRIEASGIGVVVLEDTYPDIDKICCVKSDEKIAGAMAAQLFSNMIRDGIMLVAEGAENTGLNYKNSLINIESFERTLSDYGFTGEVIRIRGDRRNVYEEACRYLEECKNINGMYSPNARNSVPFADALEKSGRASEIVLIGSELFSETVAYMNRNTIRAVIYKDPFDQGYKGFRRLFDTIIKKESFFTGDVVNTIPQIVMKANISCYGY